VTAGEDDDLLTLPFLRPGSWLRWLVPVAGLLLFVGLGVALWQISDRGDPRKPNEKKVARNNGAGTGDQESYPDPNKDKTSGKPADTGTVKDNSQAKKDGGKGKDKGPPPPQPKGVKDEDKGVEAPPPPSKERAVVARYVGAQGRMPTALARRSPDGESWERLKKGDSVYSTDSLVSLPGFISELTTKGGAGLLLRGHVPEFSRHPLQDFMMESAVVLHKNDKFDLDLTLQRGRIYLSNTRGKGKGTVKVRLRFEGEVWDLTLEPGSEVGIDLLKRYTRDINYRANEDPRAELYLCLLRGEAELRVDYVTHNLEALKSALFLWDNFTRPRGPLPIKEVPDIWSKDPPSPSADNARAAEAIKEMTAALRGLEGRLATTRTVDVALKEGVEKDDARPAVRMLAIYSMAAIDDMNELIDRLDDDNLAHALDRDTTVFALRRWISRSARQGRLLYDEDKDKNKTGLLLDRKWQTSEAQTLFDLLHDFSDEDRRNPDTYEALAVLLESRRVAVAEIGFWHLRRMALGVDLPPFNAAMAPDDRKRVADAVRELIKKGKLPPPPPKAEEKGPPKKPKGE
jgi:hypothetical protein